MVALHEQLTTNYARIRSAALSLTKSDVDKSAYGQGVVVIEPVAGDSLDVSSEGRTLQQLKGISPNYLQKAALQR